MEKESRLQRLGRHIRPKDRPVESIELGSVLERVIRERYKTKQIKMRGTRRAPSPEKNVEADDEVDEADNSQAKEVGVVRRLRNDLDRRLEGNAISGNGVENLAPWASAVKCALKIGAPGNWDYPLVAAFAHPAEQIPRLDACVLPRQVRQDLLGKQTTCGFAPPDAIIGLLAKVTLLQKVEDSQHEECSRGQGQQRSLHAVQEACLHGRELLYN